jgi:threonine dehydratase
MSAEPQAGVDQPGAPVGLAAIRQAADRLRTVVRRTPLVTISMPGEPQFLAKCENLQLAGAFKIRGAYNMMAQLTDEQRRRGVITYSSGNHGQAVALAAKLLGGPAVIVMPSTAPAIKVDGAREFGAEVIFEGTTSAHRKVRAEAEAERRGLTMVPPFDHGEIIAGQGTIGLEILDGRSDIGTVYVPVGGGGLISGIAAAIKRLRPEVRIVGVEPAGAAKMTAALAAGTPVTLERTASLADGLMPVRAGDLTFAHVRAFVDRMVTVEDDEIAGAVMWLLRRARLVVEPSGAASVAAALKDIQAAARADEARVAVLSGGNMALETLNALAQIADGVRARTADARLQEPG